VEAVISIVVFVLFFIFVLPWLFKQKRKQVEKAIAQYNEQNQTEVVVEKAGMPPLKHWLRNRKGDAWGLVAFPDGTRKWVRLRNRLFSKKDPLTFYNA